MKRLEEIKISKGLLWHLENGYGISDTVYRYGSKEFCNIIIEARRLYNEGKLLLEGRDKAIASLKTGEEAIYKGKKVKLHLPNWDKTEKKKFSVYLDSGKKDKETGLPVAKILRFGDPNSTIKNHIKSRADNFQARHNCDEKIDIDAAGFWSCNIHLFADHLNLNSNYPW